jgi:hypothetical protein
VPNAAVERSLFSDGRSAIDAIVLTALYIGHEVQLTACIHRHIFACTNISDLMLLVARLSPVEPGDDAWQISAATANEVLTDGQRATEEHGRTAYG